MGAKSHKFCLFSVYFHDYLKKMVQNSNNFACFVVFFCRFVGGILNVYIDIVKAIIKNNNIDKDCFGKYRYGYQQGGFGKYRY